MESIFTLPYSECQTIIGVQKFLKKSDGYSFYVPTSRQQKGIDFLIHNSKNNKLLRAQVKSSLSYINDSPTMAEGKFRYNLWFNNFLNNFPKGLADIYLLFGLFPVYNTNHQIKSKDKFWKNLILLFYEDEILDLLKEVKTKKKKNQISFLELALIT